MPLLPLPVLCSHCTNPIVNKRFPYHRLCWLLLLLFALGNAAAQTDTTTTELPDSLKSSPVYAPEQDTVSSVVQHDSEDSGVAESYPMDTSIFAGMRPLQADSLRIIRQQKAYSWQHWLDSLLRAQDKLNTQNRRPPDLSFRFLEEIFLVLKWILGLAVVFVLGLVIYKLFLSDGSLLLRNRRNVEVQIEEEAVLSPEHFGQQIAAAEAKKDFRMAIRYRYLKILHRLAEKNLLVPGTEKTNYQYLAELRKTAPDIARRFQSIVTQYEYVWYGEYPLPDSLYREMATGFTQFTEPLES